MKVNKVSQTVATVLVFLIFGALVTGSMLSSCAPTGEEEVTISPERQKAIQDSLKREWEKRLNIAWSLGYENYKNKMYRDCLKHFWKVAELDTVERFPLVYNYLGESYINLDIPDSARIAYELGVENYPQKAYYHRNLAYILNAQGEIEEAIPQYKKAIELDDKPKADDYRVLGNLLIRSDRIDEAIPVYQKLIELDPSDPEAQNILAQVLKTTGDEDAALEAQESALEKDPDNTKLMYSLGESYFNRGEYQQAIEKFKMYIERFPEDAYALEFLGNAYQNLGKFRDAIATYERILSLKPDNKKVLCEMATSYRELGQYPKARRTARQALNIDPDYGLAHIVIGEIYESAADDCISKREKRVTNIDDKLVYQLAFNEYAKAAQDPMYADLARRKMNYIKPEIPTTEDKFMHPNLTQARLDCYQWIY